MFHISQHIANEIAKTQNLIYPITKKLFQAKTEEEAEEIELRIMKQSQEKGLTQRTSLALLVVLPLLLESRAITKYINQNNDYDLRMMMPEILSIDEAIGLADKEKNYALTNIEKESLRNIIKLFLNTSKL